MAESTRPFLGMISSREDAHFYPEISSYTNESVHPFRGLRRSMNESANLFTRMNSLLYRAAEEGNEDAIAGNTELNIFEQFTGLGNSALHIAVARGNLRFIEKLLEEINKKLVAGREFVRARNLDGNTALHLAAIYGRFEIVEKIIGLMEGDVEAGNFKRLQNHEGNTALHEVAKAGNCEVVKVLLRHYRDEDLASISNHEGETALFMASQRGHTAVVGVLLNYLSPDSNMKRDDGQTPLHTAVFYGCTGVVERLLRRRPDLATQTDRYGRSAMHMLVLTFPVSGFIGLIEKYIERKTQRFTVIAELLLKTDNSLCYKVDNKKQTPLHMAVEWAKHDLVRILLMHGRDCLEAVDNEGRKPLHLAVLNAARLSQRGGIVQFHQSKKIMLSLMSRESLNHRDNEGRTALHIAVENIEKDAALITVSEDSFPPMVRW